MEQIRISVIVPVYNVEKYLPGCLDSVLAQTLLPSMEVIFVDDGSTDSSPQILAECARRCDRMTVIRQPNSGPSAARNAGMDAARGEYLLFLDSDDKLASPDSAEQLYALAQADSLDMLFFDARVRYESDSLRATSSETPDFYIRRRAYPAAVSGPALYLEMERRGEYRSNVYLYLLRRSLAEERHLRFPVGIYHEDEAFTLEALSLAARASYAPIVGYERFWREGSIMTQQGAARRIHGNLMAAREMLRFAREELPGADTKFLRHFRHHARAINLRGYRQYDKLSPEDRQAFLDGLDEADRPAVLEQLRLGERSLRGHKLRRRIKGLVPEGLLNRIKAWKRR